VSLGFVLVRGFNKLTSNSIVSRDITASGLRPVQSDLFWRIHQFAAFCYLFMSLYNDLELIKSRDRGV